MRAERGFASDERIDVFAVLNAVVTVELRMENGKCRIAESFSFDRKRANPPFSIFNSQFSISILLSLPSGVRDVGFGAFIHNADEWHALRQVVEARRLHNDNVELKM